MFKTYLKQIHSHNPREEQPSEIAAFGNVTLIGLDGFNWGLVFSHLKLGNIVHCICNEEPPKQFHEGLCDEGLQIYSMYKDPCGWMDIQQSANKVWSELIILNELENGKKNIIFIDRIDKALLYQSESMLLKHINTFKQDNRVSQIIIGCASDVISNSFRRALSYSCSCTIDLSFLNSPVADITFKKRSGKVIRTSEEFSLNSDCSLKETKLLNSKAKSVKVEDSSSSFQSTFNLSTTVEQEEARRGVVLPHTRIQNSSGTTIHYVPDEGDDWDDEDPDEDLEI